MNAAAAIERFDNMNTIDGVAPARIANATLVSSRSTEVTRSQLAMLPAPDGGTATFKPVAHIELVRGIEATLAVHNIRIAAEKFSLARENDALFGVMDLVGVPNSEGLVEFNAAMGLRTANDKSMSIQLGVGAKVFICDNLAFHADMIALKRKHTSGLDLLASLREAVLRFIEKFRLLAYQFDNLKQRMITDAEAKVKIYDAFAKGMVAPRYFPLVNTAYFAPKQLAEGNQVPFDENYAGTMWALHNAFTWALKGTSLRHQQEANQALAREFSLS